VLLLDALFLCEMLLVDLLLLADLLLVARGLLGKQIGVLLLLGLAQPV